MQKGAARRFSNGKSLIPPTLMNSPKETLIDWLRDAYAMERGLESALEKQSEATDLIPTLRVEAARHLEETKRHADDVKRCLERLGSDTSTIKVALAKVSDAVRSAGSVFASDEQVKNILAAYATENFEIACYTALRAAAEGLGETEIVAVCEHILEDERRMADILLENIPAVIEAHLGEAVAA